MNEQIDAQELISKSAREIISRVRQTIFGQDLAIEMLATAFIASGHAIVEGPPGIAKTLLAKSFAKAIGLKFNRIQFTPDLMPSDITGVNIFNAQDSSFRFAPGPIFSDVVLADEVNRTPPKTQSAMLESMEESQVTIDGIKHPLSDCFFVIATQNPIEYAGTYPLPEAQLDRFLVKIVLSYPPAEEERRVIKTFSSSRESEILNNANFTEIQQDLLKCRRLVSQISLSDAIADYIQRILQATRINNSLLLGASSRAGIAIARTAKVRAAIAGRAYVIPDDVKYLAKNVLAHRVIIKPDYYSSEISSENIIEETIDNVELPSLINPDNNL